MIQVFINQRFLLLLLLVFVEQPVGFSDQLIVKFVCDFLSQRFVGRAGTFLRFFLVIGSTQTIDQDLDLRPREVGRMSETPYIAVFPFPFHWTTAVCVRNSAIPNLSLSKPPLNVVHPPTQRTARSSPAVANAHVATCEKRSWDQRTRSLRPLSAIAGY